MRNKLIQYGWIGVIRMICYYINTKLFFRKSSLIRLPIDIRGKKFIDFGKSLTTGKGCRIEAYPYQINDKVLFFGNNVELNDYVHITAMKGIFIGDNVLMASKIYISDCTHGFYEGNRMDSSPEQAPNERKYNLASVHIGNNVWIGESVSILPGVTIGDGSIIGANSVVTRSIPANSIAVGIPAKVVKNYNLKNKTWEKV